MREISDLQRIVARVENSEGNTLGTAFTLHQDGLLVTCAHVLSRNNIGPGQEVRVRFVADWNTPRLAQVLSDGWKFDKKDDIAFLQVKKLPDNALVSPFLEWQGLEQETVPISILTCGFPISKDKELVVEGKITQLRFGLEENPELLLDSKNITHGMSGGPVLDARPGMGGIVGMICQVYEGPEVKDLAKAAPIETILACVPNIWNVSTQESTAVQEYRISVIQKLEFLDLRDASWLGNIQLPLEKVFVKLRAIDELPARDVPFNIELLKTRGVIAKEDKEESGRELLLKPPSPPVPIERALKDSQHLVVLGEPGSGKTTLLHYLALQFAKERDVIGLKQKADRLPIYLRLIEYAQEVNRLSLSKYLVEKMADQLPAYLIESYLRNGRCVLLLDALDEVSNDRRRSVADRIDEFLHTPSFSQNRIVITSRIAGYHVTRLQAQSVKHYTLCAFQPNEILEFSNKWFNAINTARQRKSAQPEVEQLTDTFIHEITVPGIQRLMDNPLLLRIAAALYLGSEDATLSNILPNRASLYQRYTTQLLHHRDESKNIKPFWDGIQDITEDEVYRALQEIAWAMHNTQTPISSRQLVTKLRKELEWSRSDVEEFLIRLRERTGLLAAYAPATSAEPDESLIAFSHLSFREFFVARHIFNNWQRNPEDTWKVLRPIRHHAEMRQPLLLLAGIFSYELEDGTFLIQKLWQANSEESNEIYKRAESILQRDLLMAGQCLIEMGKSQLDSKVYEAFLDELMEVWKRQPFIRLRDEIMSIVGSVADLEFKHKLATQMVDLLGGGMDEDTFSYDLHNAVVRSVGQIGILNDDILDKLTGVLPGYDDEPLADRDTDWGNRFAMMRIRDRQPLTRLQKSAIESLWQLNATTPDVLDGIVKSLKIPSEIVRSASADVIKEISKANPEIIERLAVLLNEPLYATRYLVAELLAQIAETNPLAITVVANVLTDKNKSWYERESAITSLEKLITNTRGNTSSLVYEVLIETLDDESYGLAKKAIEALGKAVHPDFLISLKVVCAIIRFRYTREGARHESTGAYIARNEAQNMAVGVLADLLEQDAPFWLHNKVHQSQFPLYPLLLSGSVVIESIILFIQMLYEQNPELGEFIAFKFCDPGEIRGLMIEEQEGVLRSLNSLPIFEQTILNTEHHEIVPRWHRIRQELQPIVEQLQGSEEDVLRNIIVRIFHPTMFYVSFRDGLRDRLLIEQAATSTKALEFLREIMRMTGNPLDDSTSERYAKDIDRIPAIWAQYSPSLEIINDLCSIAGGNSGTDTRNIAIRFLSKLESPPPKVRDLLIQLLGDDKVHRAAAEAIGELGYTDSVVIEALLDDDNNTGTNIWYAYTEREFIKSLAKLGHNYENTDKIIKLFSLAAQYDPASNLDAIEGLGQLGHPTPDAIKVLIDVLPSVSKRRQQAAMSSLMQLAQSEKTSSSNHLTKDQIISALIDACEDHNDYLDPNVEAMSTVMQREFMMRFFPEQYNPTAELFRPLHLPDIHNYAYNALWSVVTGELVNTDIV